MTLISDRFSGVESTVAIKAPVRVATTANITLSGLQTIDGVSVVANDRVLVKDQTDPIQNGIYVVQTGTWTRAKDFDGARDIASGTEIYAVYGAMSSETTFRLVTADPVVGSTALSFKSDPSTVFASVSDLTAASAISLGSQVTVETGYNGEPETFDIVAASTYTANAQEVVDLTGISGQAVSARTWFKTYSERAADTRSFADDILVTVPGIGVYKAVSSGGHSIVTNAGGQLFEVQKDQNGFNCKAFGALGTGLTNDAAALQAAVAASIADGGGRVFAPRGVYLVDETIDLSPWYGSPAVIFEGEGYGPWNKDGGVATSEHATLFNVTADGFNVFNIAATGQSVVRNLSLRDTAATRVSGAAIYLERNGDGIVGDDGNVTGVLLQQIGIKGFYDGVQAVRLQTSTIDQLFIEDCVRDGIRLESTGVGAGTSVTVQNTFVKEVGQDCYGLYGMSYTELANCAADAPGRYGYYLDGATRNNTSIVLNGCGCEYATTACVYLTSGNLGVVLNGCGFGPVTAGDCVYSESDITILGGYLQQASGYGANIQSGSAATIMGTNFTSNTAGNVATNNKVVLINTSISDALLLGHSVSTGVNDADIAMRNAGMLRFANNAGTSCANYGIRGGSTDDLTYEVLSGKRHTFGFGGTNRMQMEELNDAFVMRFLGEVTADPDNPSSGQARLFLKDNGSGKTQLAVRFNTGSALILATEP